MAPSNPQTATVGLRFRETGFCRAETAASKRPVKLNRSSTETKSRTKNPPFGAIRTASGNLCLYRTVWWARELCHGTAKSMTCTVKLL